MPYNATWVEPWMRPLKKQSRRTKRVRNQTANLRLKLGANRTIHENQPLNLNQSPNGMKRRATRLRRASVASGRNWSNKFKSKRLTSKRLGSKI
jgi:hypothetical protein